MLTPEEEEELKKGLKAGGRAQQEAGSRLYYKFKEDFIRNVIYKYSLTVHEFNDAYDTAILAVIQQVLEGKYEKLPGKTLEDYAAGIFHKKCIDILRKNRPPDKGLDSLEDDITDVIEPIMEAKEFLKNIHLCYGKLGEPCKTLLMLTERGFTDKEIAKFMSYKTDDVVKSARSICRKKLRECLKFFNHG